MLMDAVLKKKIAMWIGKYVTGSFHDQFEVVYGIEQMIVDDNMT
jgi:hypothetical protein